MLTMEQIINHVGLDLIKTPSFTIIFVHYTPESRISFLQIFPENYSRFFVKNV